VLAPRLPRDATALLGLTAVDLYPRRDWNYVFGFASYHHHVGVVSMYRMGTPVEGHAKSQRTVLLRTLRIAAHETAHTLAIRHCVKHRCNMGGMNYTGELDRRPLALCPECLAKVLWATGCDPAARYRRLVRFCRRHGLAEQARRFEALRRAAARMTDSDPSIAGPSPPSTGLPRVRSTSQEGNGAIRREAMMMQRRGHTAWDPAVTSSLRGSVCGLSAYR